MCYMWAMTDGQRNYYNRPLIEEKRRETAKDLSGRRKECNVTEKSERL